MKEEDMETLDGIIYLCCEFCEFWTDGDGPCKRRFKPRTYQMIGGQNPELHRREQCFYKNGSPKYWLKASDIEQHVINNGLFNGNASQCSAMAHRANIRCGDD